MRVGYFQYAVISRNREANLAYISAKLKGTSFDLLVLPELFTSGYAFDTPELILPFVEELEDSPTIRSLQQIATETGGCITGTIPEGHNGLIYNTAILVDASGLIGYHRKIHLPEYEKRYFAEGNQIETFNVKDSTIGMMVCFDCWFAPLSSRLRQLGAQIVCHSACFGGEVTPHILPIRALENQNYVISCNRVGAELFEGEKEAYRGESQIVDPDGKILHKSDNQEELVFLDIDLNTVDKPNFGSLITKDFTSEHNKYLIKLE